MELANLTPRQQLHAPRLTRRVVQLVVGLTCYGVSMAMMLRSYLGLMPWDVFHYGAARWVPLSFGGIVIATGAAVLLLWVPLRQLPGLGTVLNAVLIGLVSDATLTVLGRPEAMPARIGLLLGGVLLNAVAGALYIGAQLGPGPRDGLMTGLAARTGWSIRVVRTSIEVSVLSVGFLLGGTLGLGTALYAVAIGPLLQLFLPLVTVPLSPPAVQPRRDVYGEWLAEYRPACPATFVRPW